MSYPRAPLRRLGDVHLGKMVQPQRRSEGDVEAPYLRAAHVQPHGQVVDVEPKLMWFAPGELGAHDLRRGDVVVVEGGAGFGRSATIREDRAGWGFQNSIVRFRPRPLVSSGRFVDYALQSSLGAGEIEAACFSATIPHFTADKVAAFVVPAPQLDEQRAIADFLDRETARIDVLIEEQLRLIDLLRERRASVVDLILAEHGLRVPERFEEYGDRLPDEWRVILLGRTLRQLTNGFVGPTRDILVDEGIRYIQSTHIKSGAIAFERRPFYVAREWHDERPRIHLHEGDVLIVQTGDIGKVAVVPPDFGDASCHALQIARTHRDLVSGEYLAAFLTSRLGYQSLAARATGALHPHLEAGIRSAPIVVPPLDVQNRIVDEAAEHTSRIDTLIEETERFIELSRERRSALITAAVTGQIDVRGAVA
ncbi:hypothetical protein MAUB1S_03172 [Mycolicibacterium aubagnense]